MPTPEMQKAISRLRFLLAAIKGKEEELESQGRQFRRQLERTPIQAIHGGHSVEATLSVMAEVQERLDNVESVQKHLAAIKARAEGELQALELTDKIERAKTELVSLKTRQSSAAQGEAATQQRIEDLERFIQEGSIRAGQSITGRLEAGGAGGSD